MKSFNRAINIINTVCKMLDEKKSRYKNRKEVTKFVAYLLFAQLNCAHA